MLLPWYTNKQFVFWLEVSLLIRIVHTRWFTCIGAFLNISGQVLLSLLLWISSKLFLSTYYPTLYVSVPFWLLTEEISVQIDGLILLCWALLSTNSSVHLPREHHDLIVFSWSHILRMVLPPLAALVTGILSPTHHPHRSLPNMAALCQDHPSAI